MQSTANFSYRAIVFKLKDGIIFEQCLPGKKLLGYRSVILAEHPPQDDTDCEWNGLHYHGIVEHPPQYRFDGDRVFNQFKTECCEWFKSEQCKLPVNFLAYMAIPPRREVYNNIRNEESDLPCLQAQVTEELILQVSQRKADRVAAKKEGNMDIMYIKDLILRTNAQSESELLNYYHNDERFENIYCKRTFSTNFKKALNFAIQSTLDKPIRDLASEYIDMKGECMTPTKSANIMEKWCAFQNIEKKQFIRHIVDVMDKNRRKLNTLILQGEPNSGKTFIAKSLQKASLFYGEVSQGIAGYTFMWQDCVNKRLIVINEPYFDNCMIEQLKIILEGTGTFVHKKNTCDEYLRPTPVVITTNYDVWRTCANAETAIRARCIHIYKELKAAPFLRRVRKDLHPGWISHFILNYLCKEATTSDFSDDECHTSPAIDTADQEQTLRNQTPLEDLPTSWTPAADNTTSTLPETPQSAKRPPTDDLLRAPRKKARLETSSPSLLEATQDSDTSLDLEEFYQDLKSTRLPYEKEGKDPVPSKKQETESTGTTNLKRLLELHPTQDPYELNKQWQTPTTKTKKCSRRRVVLPLDSDPEEAEEDQ